MGCNKMTTLKKLILYPTHGDLARRLSPNGGPENYKVKHTPQVESYEQLNRMNRMEVWHFRAFIQRLNYREIISIVSCIILKFFPNFIIYIEGRKCEDFLSKMYCYPNNEHYRKLGSESRIP